MFIPLFFIIKYRQPILGKMSSQPLLMTRSTLGLIGVLLNIYAIDHMVLSDADTLMKLNPFWTILLSLIFLKENIKRYQIIAMLIAIFGMLFIVKPNFLQLCSLFSRFILRYLRCICIYLCTSIK